MNLRSKNKNGGKTAEAGAKKYTMGKVEAGKAEEEKAAKEAEANAKEEAKRNAKAKKAQAAKAAREKIKKASTANKGKRAAEEAQEPKSAAEADKQQEEAEKRREERQAKQRKVEEEQAEEFPSDSDEEDEEPPESGEDVKWSAEVAGSAPQRRRGPARAIQVPAKYCPDAGKKHTATLTSPEYGLMRVKLAAGADKGAKFKFIIFRPGQEQDEYVVRSNKVLEEKLQAAAEEQPEEANLIVMGAEMDKKQLGILEERGGEIFELSKLCAPDEEEFADIEEYILEGEMDVNSVKGALACMSAVDKAKSGNRLGTNATVTEEEKKRKEKARKKRKSRARCAPF